jgi:hypothetical protein
MRKVRLHEIEQAVHGSKEVEGELHESEQTVHGSGGN